MKIKIEDYFEENTNGQFIINGKWYIPLYGCDTIQYLLDDINSQLELPVNDDFCGNCEKPFINENKIYGFCDLDNDIKFDSLAPLCKKCIDEKRKFLIEEKASKDSR